MYLSIKELLQKLGNLKKKSPNTMRSFQEFDKIALENGTIPAKYKELIALGVALTTQCVYCLEIHKQNAIKNGATQEEIAETIFVAAALRAGAAVTHGTHILD